MPFGLLFVYNRSGQRWVIALRISTFLRNMVEAASTELTMFYHIYTDTYDHYQKASSTQHTPLHTPLIVAQLASIRILTLTFSKTIWLFNSTPIPAIELNNITAK